MTLVEAKDGRCYGRAFLIKANVFEHLDQREINGYRREDVEIYFDDDRASGVTYRAPRGNFAFLGNAPAEEMVAQINRCAGRSLHARCETSTFRISTYSSLRRGFLRRKCSLASRPVFRINGF